MAEELMVSNWEEFVAKTDVMRTKQYEEGGRALPLWFRGHANSKWALETTLERQDKLSMPFIEYYAAILQTKFQVETFTGNQWPMADYTEVLKLVENYGSFSQALSFGRWPGAEYMAYLRHHGFPSPFLDWTRSPFIAAFFAFRHLLEDQTHVSIYTLSESKMTSGSSNSPRVYHLGPNIKTHKRHFLQQSSYTMCLGFNADHEWQFVSHEAPQSFRGPGLNERANFTVHKFNIPITERPRVLKILDDLNLNAFSLFGTEESLIETMALREFTLQA